MGNGPLNFTFYCLAQLLRKGVTKKNILTSTSVHFVDLEDGEYVLLFVSNDKFYTSPVLNYDEIHNNEERTVYLLLFEISSNKIIPAHLREITSSSFWDNDPMDKAELKHYDSSHEMFKKWIELYDNFLNHNHIAPFLLEFAIKDGQFISFSEMFFSKREKYQEDRKNRSMSSHHCSCGCGGCD